MASLRTDFYINNENQGQAHGSKNDTARKHTAKKAVFGELKNVIHNQLQPKSLKYDEPSIIKSKCMLKPTQQGPKNKIKSPHTKHTAGLLNEDAEIEMLKYFDYAPSCCTKPYKSDREIWAEMDMFDDSLIGNITQDSFLNEESENDSKEHYYFDDSGCDIPDFDDSKLFPTTQIIDPEDDIFSAPSPLMLPPSSPLPDFEDF
ncbi:uncharacterized protein LOC142230288 isoform X2 [Haematobia irritans]|uniref:uncharacterized protein LOC142230288 isoform X2 n=1 Tax=Haematobia irritans TaxID=7368 RepID=UPI003F4FE096